MAHVLVINDSADLLEAIALALDSAGHDVTTLGDAARALELARSSRPDVILLDWATPTVDGGQVLGVLRRSDVAHVPVIVISAIPDLGRQAVVAGAVAFLPKPFDLDDLTRLVDRFSGGDPHPLAIAAP